RLDLVQGLACRAVQLDFACRIDRLFRVYVQAAMVGVPPLGGFRFPAEVGTPTNCHSHLEAEEPTYWIGVYEHVTDAVATSEVVAADLITSLLRIAPVSGGGNGCGLGVIGGPDDTRTVRLRNDGRVLTGNGLRARIGVGPEVLIPPNRWG
ncbi:MAG: hypothetical protein U1E05_03455, partial [Patescibacteria group bacterium]|nr:hypothetical protein [Patescibacteria group bacterium]